MSPLTPSIDGRRMSQKWANLVDVSWRRRRLSNGIEEDEAETMIFSSGTRTDGSPLQYGESEYAFLDRCADSYFAEVRRVMEEWMLEVPPEHRVSMERSLASSDDAFQSAFWELYLHEAYRRSGYEIKIHPDLPDSPRHPDFLLSSGDDQFYLEAVRVGRSRSEIADEKRLDVVKRVVNRIPADQFIVSLTTYTIGSRSLPTGRLRDALRKWLGGLDPNVVASLAKAGIGFSGLPELQWTNDDWSLEFHALPLKSEARGRPTGLLGVQGPGEAVIVDNVTGIGRALEIKAAAYGPLDLPLVIAVLSNTVYPTRLYEIENALYGISSYRPTESPDHPESLFRSEERRGGKEG